VMEGSPGSEEAEQGPRQGAAETPGGGGASTRSRPSFIQDAHRRERGYRRIRAAS
jgi:hypothetical protein